MKSIKTGIALFVIVLLCSTNIFSETTFHPNKDELWHLVANSHIIATGTLVVPIDEINSCLKSNIHKHMEILVKDAQSIKGPRRNDITVTWYTEPLEYAPKPENVIELNEKKVLIFLININHDFNKGTYFAGYTQKTLSLVDDSLLFQVQREVENQRKMLASFKKDFPFKSDSIYLEVQKLIDATTDKKTQANAFKRLEELGTKAVPPIIILMDDRRRIGFPNIVLSNGPGHWEAARHYGPERVVDAMHAILEQISDQSFGTICNGGSNAQRRYTVSGWRIYLYYWKAIADSQNKQPGENVYEQD